jgi:hypothetical protein
MTARSALHALSQGLRVIARGALALGWCVKRGIACTIDARAVKPAKGRCCALSKAAVKWRARYVRAASQLDACVVLASGFTLRSDPAHRSTREITLSTMSDLRVRSHEPTI